MDEREDSGKVEDVVSEAPDDVDVVARRRLLKVMAYTAPAVVGTLLVSNDALAQPTSCPPNTGCQPNCGPSVCNPSGG